MAAPYIEPLDLRYILINTLSGHPDVFIAISLIVVTMISAFFRMTGAAYLFILVLWIIIIQATLDVSAMYIVVLILGGLIIFRILASVIKN